MPSKIVKNAKHTAAAKPPAVKVPDFKVSQVIATSDKLNRLNESLATMIYNVEKLIELGLDFRE